MKEIWMMQILIFILLHIMYYIFRMAFCLIRRLFRKMVSPDCCTMATLHEGEAYATQGISKTDKLGLLISGRCSIL